MTELGGPRVAEATALHQRPLDDDPTAPGDLAVAYLDALANWLEVRNPRLGDPHLDRPSPGEAATGQLKS